MSTADTATKVERYLDELRRHTIGLPPERVQDLLADVTEHIDSALAEIEHPTAADVDHTLARLGDPATIADAARREFGTTSGTGGITMSSWWPAVTVFLLLLGGIVVPFVGWLAGVAMLWSSNLWTRRDKVIASLVPGGLLPAFLLPLLSSGTGTTCVQGDGVPVQCTGGPSDVAIAVAWVVLAVFVALPLYSAVRLLRRAGRG